METFGVEFEFDSRRVKLARLREIARKLDHGVMVDQFRSHLHLKDGRTVKIAFHDYQFWTLKDDDSCGYEIASKILKSNPAGIAELKTAAKLLTFGRSNPETCPVYSHRCGFHVHIDDSTIRDNVEKNFFRFLFLSKKVIYKMLSSQRREKGNYGCVYDIDDSYDRDDFFDNDAYAYMDEDGVRSCTAHNTIEVRMSRGLCDPDQIVAYVQFLLIVMSICKRLPKTYFRQTYRKNFLREGYFDKNDVAEFILDEKTTHAWLETRKKSTLKTLKII